MYQQSKAIINKIIFILRFTIEIPIIRPSSTGRCIFVVVIIPMFDNYFTYILRCELYYYNINKY